MKRAVGLIYKLEPYFYVLELLRAIIIALLPISAVYFSAAIVTELSEGKRVNVLSGWVIASVITLFLLFSLKSVLDLKSRGMEERFELKFATYLNSRFALLDYPYTEQQEILSLFRKVMSNHFALGGGVLRVYRFIPVLMNSLAGLLMSMLLLKGMFDNVLEGQPQKRMGTVFGILLLVFIVLGVVLNAGVGIHFQKKIFKLMEELPNSNHMVAYYEEYLSPAKAGKDIRIYNQKDYILNIFKNRFGGIPLFIGESNATSWQVGIASVTISILNIMVYLLIGLRALYGWYPIGGVVQYVGAVNNLIVTLSQFSSVVTSLWTNQKFLKDQFLFLDLKTLPEEEVCQEMIYPTVIEFHDVSFQYPGAKTWALRHLNLKIEGTGRIAVVGQNGSGKTTMVKLLCRLYEPTEGKITINGTDIFEFPNADYKRMLSPVFQDFILPSLPIGQIIACGVEYDKEKVEQCLAKAGLAEKIAGLPMGLHTPLNHEVFPEGTSLSGGEMQKLAIARSIYKDAAIMVLDEPTSALDPISEYEIYSQFDKIVSNKMAIYVSHRLSSCKFCDRIFVFGNGKLMGEGTHEELFLEKNEIYCKLWNAQSQYYQE